MPEVPFDIIEKILEIALEESESIALEESESLAYSQPEAQDVRAYALTSRAFWSITRPRLFSTVSLSGDRGRRVELLNSLLDASPEIASYVRDLDYDAQPEDEADLELHRLFERLVSIRTLNLSNDEDESPIPIEASEPLWCIIRQLIQRPTLVELAISNFANFPMSFLAGTHIKRLVIGSSTTLENDILPSSPSQIANQASCESQPLESFWFESDTRGILDAFLNNSSNTRPAVDITRIRTFGTSYWSKKDTPVCKAILKAAGRSIQSLRLNVDEDQLHEFRLASCPDLRSLKLQIASQNAHNPVLQQKIPLDFPSVPRLESIDIDIDYWVPEHDLLYCLTDDLFPASAKPFLHLVSITITSTAQKKFLRQCLASKHWRILDAALAGPGFPALQDVTIDIEEYRNSGYSTIRAMGLQGFKKARRCNADELLRHKMELFPRLAVRDGIRFHLGVSPID